MFIANILLTGCQAPKLIGVLASQGYRAIPVSDHMELESIKEPYALTIIGQRHLREHPISLERLYFLSDLAPVAVLIDTPGDIDENVKTLIRQGTLECFYEHEIDSEMIVSHIDRLYIDSHLDKLITSLQQNTGDKVLLEKEISVRDKALARIHEINDSIFMSITSGLILIDHTGVIILINELASRFLNILQDSIGEHFSRVLPKYLHPLIAPGGSIPMEKFPSLSIKKTLHSGVQHVQITNFCLCDANHYTTGVMLLLQDITEQEENSIILYRAEKLASMGTMLSGIAHELRNPLSIISARCQRALNSEWDHDWAMKAFQSVERQSERCATMVNNLLDFVHYRAATTGFIALKEIIDEALACARYHENFLTITIAYDPKVDIIVYGDRSRYVQVFLNLITNALDAMNGKGSLTIESRPHRQDTAMITITDTGPGIPQEIQSRIFDPFFTTKEPGKGTGLGLSIVYTILRESGGEISVSSAPGATTFTVLLPTAKAR